MKKITRTMLLMTSLLVFLLASCSSPASRKTTLQNSTETVRSSVKTELAAIDQLSNAVNSFPSTFQSAYQDDKTQNFTTTGPVAALLDKRNTAYQQLEQAQAKLASATTSLTKANNQAGSNLPKTALKSTLNSLHLAALDHKTYETYYQEMKTAEGSFFKDVSQAKTGKDVDTALTQVTQYGSAIAQQGDIVTANLQTVGAEAKKLETAIEKMD